jgi:hypothetical protein
MEHVFKDVPDTHIYLDDVLAGVSTIDDGLAGWGVAAAGRLLLLAAAAAAVAAEGAVAG